MGHVEICPVLERIYTDSDRDDNSLFHYTAEIVAIKVNCMERMDQISGRHDEDPISEIGSSQLVGTNHPHVIRCNDVLFDKAHVYIVMTHCDSGDLFDCLE